MYYICIIGTLQLTERQRDGNVSRQRVIEKKLIIIVLNNSFEYWTRGSHVVLTGKLHTFTYCIQRQRIAYSQWNFKFGLVELFLNK